MPPIAIAPTVSTIRLTQSGDRSAPLGARAKVNASVATHAQQRPVSVGTTVDAPAVKRVNPQAETLEKVVRRIPTLYVVAFFGVVVGCAVLIIWNTIQVNRLTLERTKTQQRIAELDQRTLRLKAEEMQLSAQSRVTEIAKRKLRMIELSGSDVIIMKSKDN